MAGWVKVHRDIQNCWIWEEKPFSRGQAFIDLILMVNHEDKKIMFNGTLTEIKRGSGITSIRKLSDKWGWSKNKVDHFLKQLQSDEMISYKKDTKKTVVSIENYDLYQSRDFEKGQQKDIERTPMGNKKETDGKQKGTNKNDKEYIKNDKEGEEGKEVYKTQLLSFPTPTHEVIFNQFGEITYKMWFEDSIIEVKGELITITVKEPLKKEIIQNRFLDVIKTLTGKSITVKVSE